MGNTFSPVFAALFNIYSVLCLQCIQSCLKNISPCVCSIISKSSAQFVVWQQKPLLHFIICAICHIQNCFHCSSAFQNLNWACASRGWLEERGRAITSGHIHESRNFNSKYHRRELKRREDGDGGWEIKMFRQGALEAHETDCARCAGSSAQSQKCAGLCVLHDGRNSWRAPKNPNERLIFMCNRSKRISEHLSLWIKKKKLNINQAPFVVASRKRSAYLKERFN